MSDLNNDNFKTGNHVNVAEIHTANLDVSGSSVLLEYLDHPYAHITPPNCVRVGIVSKNYAYDRDPKSVAVTSSRVYSNDGSFVEFELSFDESNYFFSVRPDGRETISPIEPVGDLIASYTREGGGTDTDHMMTSHGCLNTYTRASFNQLFRAEETGILSKIKINEDFVKVGTTVVISIHAMSKDGAVYKEVGESTLLLSEPSVGVNEKFGVERATDISCIAFDVTGSEFYVSQNSLYMMTFDGSFCDMGLWGEGMSMTNMDVSGDGYVSTKKKPYPVEVTVKSTSVSGKSDSGSMMNISDNKLKLNSEVNNLPLIPKISVVHNDVSGDIVIYDILSGFMRCDVNAPYLANTKCVLSRMYHDTFNNTFRVEDVRAGSYSDIIMTNFPRAIATSDQMLVKIEGGSTAVIMSYFDISENEFKLIRCATDDLLYHPPVFNGDNMNPHYQEAVGDNTMRGFVERLVAINRSTETKQHVVPYDGVPNSGMRMVCDAVEANGNQWVAYTDLRYATNTDANVYLVNMSAASPDETKFHIPLRNLLPKADLSYRYYIATFPTISMCNGDGGDDTIRYVSVGRNVYAYDTRANTVTFISSDISVYKANVDARNASYVGTVGMDGTKMPGFSQYVDLSGGGVPYLHYTVTDVSGRAWVAKELRQQTNRLRGLSVIEDVPLNNHHMFQDEVMYDVSNTALGVRWCGLSDTTPTFYTPFHVDVSGNLNVTGDCYANNFVARHTDANSVNVNHSLWANRVEAASISIGGVELTADQLEKLIASLD